MTTELKVGDPAPGFKATAVGGIYGEGREVKLADFAGSTLVLYFYPKDDTPGCVAQACGVRDSWREIQSKAELFGVSVDSAESHEAFIKKHGLPFPLLSDPDRKLMKEWGAYGEKMMYGKKTVGIIRSSVWIGPDGTVKKHWKKVADAAKHPEQVLETLRA